MGKFVKGFARGWCFVGTAGLVFEMSRDFSICSVVLVFFFGYSILMGAMIGWDGE